MKYIFKLNSKTARKSKAINIKKKLGSKFEVDISKNELSGRFCLGEGTDFPL